MCAINECLISNLFGVNSLKKEITFYCSDLQKIYADAIGRNYEAIYDFFAYIQKVMNDESITRGALMREKKKILTSQDKIDYYNRIPL